MTTPFLVYLASSLLSLLGCCLLLGVFCSIPSSRSYLFRLVAFLCGSELLSLGWIAAVTALYTNETPGPAPGYDWLVCQVQAITTTYFQLSSVFWTTAIAYTLKACVFMPEGLHVKRREKTFHAACWLAPSLFCALLFFTKSYGYDPTFGVCYLSNEKSMFPWIGIAILTTPVLGCLVHNLIVYCKVSRAMTALTEPISADGSEFKRRVGWKPGSSVGVTQPQAVSSVGMQKRCCKHGVPLSLYPSVTLICWGPSLALHLMDLFVKGGTALESTNRWLRPLALGLLCSQGFFHSLIYLSSMDVALRACPKVCCFRSPRSLTASKLRNHNQAVAALSSPVDVPRSHPRVLSAASTPSNFSIYSPASIGSLNSINSDWPIKIPGHHRLSTIQDEHNQGHEASPQPVKSSALASFMKRISKGGSPRTSQHIDAAFQAPNTAMYHEMGDDPF